MQYVRFGPTGLQVSRFCLGAMGFGNQMDAEASARALDEALDHGMNFIDTAESYSGSEEMLGRLLGDRRGKVVLATKAYRRRALDGQCGNNSRANLLHSLEHSLRQLRTDHVELYQLHHPDALTPVEETLGALDQMVKSGKVCCWGVTNHYAWQMAHLLGVGRSRGWEAMVSYQGCYNLLDRPVELETTAFLQQFGLAFMVYSPLGGGLLSGKYVRGAEAPPDSRVVRWGPKMLAYHQSQQVHDIIDGIKAIAAEIGVTLAQLALQWLMAKPVVTSVILGGSKAEHFTPMYAIADRTLPAEVTARLDELSAVRIYKEHRNQPVTKLGDARHGQ